MFNLPQPPVTDPQDETDCPVVYTSESAQDLAYYLSTVYDSLRFFQPDAQIQYAAVEAILRLSLKFSSEPLRIFAVGRLEAAFPCKFAEWESLFYNEKPQPVVFSPTELISIANMAQEHNLEHLLPIVLYDCCQQDVDWILQGITGPDGSTLKLSKENQRSCIKARSYLTAATLKMLSELSVVRDGLCEQYTCTSILREISMGGLVKDELIHHPLVALDRELNADPPQGPQAPAAAFGMAWGAPQPNNGINNLCRACREGCKNHLRIAREKLLRNLREYIPVESEKPVVEASTGS
ncbi:hypothetical protein PHLCEN_2v4055 [Hermanssonia centrifuga]|uniref:Uncharacterized protein n=1 Tax=Hermanssonia centrifuga TaxID=98765 RepID=A0A2R6Q5G8_9APHY|nr:hypothetical protein PHLCEN_2v4055 [Hermanssonia centrifuga]